MSLIRDFLDDVMIRQQKTRPARAQVLRRGKEKLVNKLYTRLAHCHPSLTRGEVWCRKCGAHQFVNPVTCLRSGWPRCCGQTMTIDAPMERGAPPPQPRGDR